MRRNFGAGNETRTRDPDLGKVVLYQLSYSRLGGLCLTALSNFGAGNETRTRDPDLGKVVLYQLSYSRLGGLCLTALSNFGAGNETRTRDPDLGKVVLYQLSYSRVLLAIFLWRRDVHFCFVTGGALYENSIYLQPPCEHFFVFFV